MNNTQKGTAFEKLVAKIYRSMGFDVQHNSAVAGKQTDLVAERVVSGIGRQRLMVECKFLDKGRQAGNNEIYSIAGAFVAAQQKKMVSHCVVVTSNGFSTEAKEAAEAAGIELRSITELLNEALGLEQYLSHLTRDWKTNNETFVSSSGELHNDKSLPIQDFLRQRVLDPSPSITFLIGGIGSGKTTHANHLVSRLATEHSESPFRPVPLLFPLERFKGRKAGEHFDHFMVHHLRSIFGSQVSWTTLAKAIQAHLVVLILDGFDEIPQLYKPRHFRNEFQHILDTLGPIGIGSTLVTCRSSLMTNLPEVSELFEGAFKKRFPEISCARITTKPFSEAEISHFLSASKRPDILQLRDNPLTRDLISRPLLLSLASSIPREAITKAPLTEYSLIEKSIHELIGYKDHLRATEAEAQQWFRFLEKCAIHCYRSGSRHITSHDIKELAQDHLVEDMKDLVRLAQARFDAQVRSIFDIDNKGITFAHAIFRDFLAGSYLADCLLNPASEHSSYDSLMLSPEICHFIQRVVRSRSPTRPSFRNHNRPRTPPKFVFKSRCGAWRWIPPGLSLIRAEAGSLGGYAHLRYVETGFWISASPITNDDLYGQKTLKNLVWSYGGAETHPSPRSAVSRQRLSAKNVLTADFQPS